MHTVVLLAHALNLAERLGYVIRQEWLDGNGGGGLPSWVGGGDVMLGPDISHLRVRSADFQSAFSVIATVKPTASRRSGLLAFRMEHE